MYEKGKAQYIFDHDFPVTENFYSDSLSDTPLAVRGKSAHGYESRAGSERLAPSESGHNERSEKKINTGWTIHL